MDDWAIELELCGLTRFKECWDAKVRGCGLGGIGEESGPPIDLGHALYFTDITTTVDIVPLSNRAEKIDSSQNICLANQFC